MSADEMFENLGYKLSFKNTRVENEESLYLRYEDELNQYRIDFWNDETVSKQNEYCEPAYITTQELQAINQKVKELGWI